MESLTLSIADVTLGIRSPVAGVVHRFREMYGEFITDAPSCHATLEINCQNLNALIRTDELPFAVGAQMIYSNYLYAAAYDPLTRQATLVTNMENIYGFAEEYLLKLFSHLCLEQDRLMFHCATLADTQDNAYIFYGPSGIGKSTVVRNAPGLRVISDDVVILARNDNQQFRIFKTPLERNKQRGSAENTLTIKGMYRLVQASHTCLQALTPVEHLTKVLGNLWNLDFSKDGYGRAMQLLSKHYLDVPGYDLHLQKDSNFWPLLS
jgi:hypothetical protein